MICQKCGINKAQSAPGFSPQNGYMHFDRLCFFCFQHRRHICAQLNTHRARTWTVNEMCTLTGYEWESTLAHFQYRCAYCLSVGTLCLEHFVPLGFGVGTVKWNCVPACRTCNGKKRNIHPALVTRIPKADIERVRQYLMSFL